MSFNIYKGILLGVALAPAKIVLSKHMRQNLYHKINKDRKNLKHYHRLRK
jgi:hypothetical protein